jgi:glycosyltransferase involved in cell wall biosynthesis
MPKKIVFLQDGPGIGPITNNNFRFGKVLVSHGIQVELLGTNVSQDVYEAAPDGVTVKNLFAPGFSKVIFPLIKYLKENQPDVMLVSGPALHVLACLAKRITGHPKNLVLRIHAHTTSLFSDRPWWNRNLLLFLMRATHRWSDYKVSASQGAATDWANLLGVEDSSVRVMHNPAIGDDTLSRSRESANHPWIEQSNLKIIITVARLSYEKSLDVLIKAFAMLQDRENLRLIILGDGPLREELCVLARELGVSDLVDFHGWVENPYAFMSRSDVFVLTSWYEGFANVIAEALACGCPVVSTDAPSGPSEILADGCYGHLVPVGDINAVALAIEKSLSTPYDREALKKRGNHYHAKRIIFDAKYIFSIE